MARVAKAYKELSSAEVTSWDNFASTYPQYAHYNPDAELSGHALFIRTNVWRLMAGLSILESCSLTLLSEPVWSVYPTTVSDVGHAMEFYTGELTNVTNWRVILHISGIRPDTQKFKGSKTRFIKSFDLADDNFQDIQDQYGSIFGYEITSEKLVIMKVLLFSKTSAQFYIPWNFLYTWFDIFPAP